MKKRSKSPDGKKINKKTKFKLADKLAANPQKRVRPYRVRTLLGEN